MSFKYNNNYTMTNMVNMYQIYYNYSRLIKVRIVMIVLYRETNRFL